MTMWPVLSWIGKVGICIALSTTVTSAVTLPSLNSSTLSLPRGYSNSSQISVPLPDDAHSQRFDRLTITRIDIEHSKLKLPVADLAYAYLYVLEKIWQIPVVEIVGDDLSYKSDDRQDPLIVTFSKAPAASILMTTEHAAWALVNVLQYFGVRVPEFAPDDFFFNAYTWEIRTGDTLLGYMKTDYDYSTTSVSSALPMNGTAAGTGRAIDPRPSASPIMVSRRHARRSDHGLISSIEEPDVHLGVRDIESHPNAQPRGIHIVITSKGVTLWPRDVVFILASVIEDLMAHPATQRVPYAHTQTSTPDRDAFTRPIFALFQSGGDAGSGRDPPSGWTATYADVVFGLRETLRRFIVSSEFAFFSVVMSRGTLELASLEIFPLNNGKGVTGGAGGNITEYS